MGTADDSTSENRLLPAVNKVWPFLVFCVQQRNTVVNNIHSFYSAKSPRSSIITNFKLILLLVFYFSG